MGKKKETVDVPKSVMCFIAKCSKDVGKFNNDVFNEETFDEILNLQISSPIEQVLFCALKTVQHLNFIDSSEPVELGGEIFARGLYIEPQFEINPYKIDFRIAFDRIDHPWCNENSNKKYKRAQKSVEILVECDSQEWHERTEEERRYEKKRDRFLVKRGYKIFHYTGKEILARPLEIAREILAVVQEMPEEHFDIGGE